MNHGYIDDESVYYPSTRYLTSDSYGRMLYYAHDNHPKKYKEEMDCVLAIIFNPDGSYDEDTCVLELNDFYHEQDRLKEFKELNGWNQPPE